MIKMADVVCGTKCCATNILNYSTSNGFRDCAKCAELEIQLQQVREELSSVQLIIQLLNKERVQGMTDTPPIQATETQWEVDKDWEVMTQRGAKKRAEANINLSKKGLLNFRGQAVETANRYAALEADSHLLRNEDGMETIYEKTICTINKDQEEKVKHIAQNYSISSASQKTLDLESKVEHNLQNHSLAHQLSNTKKETYNIPTIISGRVSKEGTSCPIQRRTLQQGKMNLNIMRKTVKSACKRHKILVIGDSHVRDLSEKISNCLDDSFSVFGITKPNADIETITSPIHLKMGNLTKDDLIIFLGGTNDISRNEAKKGLRSLRDFTQRTINTNLILLGAPHRYDLSPQSCVNTEVKLYNKRLQSLVSISNHVRVLSMPTERRHHTRHGLHLNKKGKDWVVDNIIKEIRNWKSSCRVSSPIELPWENEMNDLGNQVSPVIVSVGKEGPSPNDKNDGHPEPGNSAAVVGSLSQTDVECLGQT